MDIKAWLDWHLQRQDNSFCGRNVWGQKCCLGWIFLNPLVGHQEVRSNPFSWNVFLGLWWLGQQEYTLLLQFSTWLSLEGFSGHKASTGLKWAPRDWSFSQWHSELASLHSDLVVCLFLVKKRTWNVGFVIFFFIITSYPSTLRVISPPHPRHSCSAVCRKACVLWNCALWELCCLLCYNL